MSDPPVDPFQREELSERLVRNAHRLASQGLSPGASGNLSVRCGQVALITPSGSALARLAPEDLIAVRIGDGAPVGDPPGRATKEAPIHLGLLRASPTIGAVVHLHSPWATALSCLPAGEDGRAALSPHTPYQVMRFGRLKVAPYAAPGTEELATGVLRAREGPGALLMAHHGLVTTHASIEAASDLAEELEAAAQVGLLLSGRSGTELGAPEVAALRRPSADQTALGTA